MEGGSCNDYDYVCGDPVNGFDLGGLRSLRQDIELSLSVAWYCSVTRAAFKCQDANAYAQTTNLVVRNLDENTDLTSQQLDALRHIYWHALMVADGFGYEWTEGLGRAYEGYSLNNDRDGDLEKNRHGADIGQAFRDGQLQGDLARYFEDFIRSGRADISTNCMGCK